METSKKICKNGSITLPKQIRARQDCSPATLLILAPRLTER